jgi:two-component system, LytTR family, response regulator LytT
MNVLIVEDEKLAAKRLQRILSGIDESIQVVAVADSVRSAVNFFKSSKKVDLAFFDIELADGQSFDIFSEAEVNCPVIFTTAYDEYALRAFKVNSIDYLLKPVDSDELVRSLEKFKKLQHKDSSSSIERLIADLKVQRNASTGYRNRFLSKQGSKMISVDVSDVAYFYSEEKITLLRTKQGNRYVINNTLDELEGSVNPELFFRANRGMIIHIGCVNEIHSWFNGKLKLKATPEHAEDIVVSRERAADFRKWVGE